MSDTSAPASAPRRFTSHSPAAQPVSATPGAPSQPAGEAPDIKPVEYGGPKGLEPTRYGDWERNGRCSDF
jgi:hypothetical protein